MTVRCPIVTVRDIFSQIQHPSMFTCALNLALFAELVKSHDDYVQNQKLSEDSQSSKLQDLQLALNKQKAHAQELNDNLELEHEHSKSLEGV